MLETIGFDECLANETSDDGCAAPLQDLAAGEGLLGHVEFNSFCCEKVAVQC